jgi:hypothetical protein
MLIKVCCFSPYDPENIQLPVLDLILHPNLILPKSAQNFNKSKIQQLAINPFSSYKNYWILEKISSSTSLVRLSTHSSINFKSPTKLLQLFVMLH